LACLAAAAGKKSVAKEPKSRSGPRAPAGKKPLMVIIDADLIKAAKIAASRTDGMFFRDRPGAVGGVAGGPEDAKMNPPIEQSGSLLFAR
jgi:hypothetical protein